MEGRRWIARERDQAQMRMVQAQPGDGRDPVEQRHVQVEHRRVGGKLVDELDRSQTVGGRADDGELTLAVDELLQRDEKTLVVVCKQDPDRALGGGCHASAISALPGRCVKENGEEIDPLGADRDVGSFRHGLTDAHDHSGFDRAGPVLGLILDFDRNVKAGRNGPSEQADLPPPRERRAL